MQHVKLEKVKLNERELNLTIMNCEINEPFQYEIWFES